MKTILCGAPAREKRDQMVEMREERDRPAVLSGEVRSDDDTILEFSGYASTFEPYEMYGGPAKGGWIEQLDRTAFDKTLRAKPDLHLLINHEGLPLARTKSGTLELSVDDGGLKSYAQLDRSDPDVQRIEPKMRRKDMDEMSFAFRVIKQRWDYAPDFEEDPYSLRIIEEVSLHKGDVSIVNFGANPTTSAELLSAVKTMAKADLRGLADIEELLAAEALRGASDDAEVQRAIRNLEMLARNSLPGNLRGNPVVVDLGSAGKPIPAPKADEGRSAAPAAAPEAPKPEPTPQAEPEAKSEGGGRKPMSLREAMRRQGFGAEDGTLLSHKEGEERQARDVDAINALRATGAAHDALLARLAATK
ncbi:HK97 family phage prohead protease [Streptomyces massasporeus]|uniref:HK97 family phage prohead protease n=1 Tax=Streptomyces massasporeus TaxID=67324 RepID=UPI0036562E2D